MSPQWGRLNFYNGWKEHLEVEGPRSSEQGDGELACLAVDLRERNTTSKQQDCISKRLPFSSVLERETKSASAPGDELRS